nr:MAG TPA: hypothetical protein [Caudoviricetes sp.]DAV03541.1 MAG TPA: hypothetical protein [Caudoviricetes sp.]
MLFYNMISPDSFRFDSGSELIVSNKYRFRTVFLEFCKYSINYRH